LITREKKKEERGRTDSKGKPQLRQPCPIQVDFIVSGRKRGNLSSVEREEGKKNLCDKNFAGLPNLSYTVPKRKKEKRSLTGRKKGKNGRKTLVLKRTNLVTWRE